MLFGNVNYKVNPLMSRIIIKDQMRKDQLPYSTEIFEKEPSRNTKIEEMNYFATFMNLL